MTEWGVPSEKLREAMDSLDDAEAAFSYMLPNVSSVISCLTRFVGDPTSQLS